MEHDHDAGGQSMTEAKLIRPIARSFGNGQDSQRKLRPSLVVGPDEPEPRASARGLGTSVLQQYRQSSTKERAR